MHERFIAQVTDKIAKDPLLTLAAVVAAYKFLHQDKGPAEKFFSDPIRFIIVIMSLAGYIYFNDSAYKDKAILEQKAGLQVVREQMDKQIVVLSQMQITQERIVKQIDKLAERDDK